MVYKCAQEAAGQACLPQMMGGACMQLDALAVAVEEERSLVQVLAQLLAAPLGILDERGESGGEKNCIGEIDQQPS